MDLRESVNNSKVGTCLSAPFFKRYECGKGAFHVCLVGRGIAASKRLCAIIRFDGNNLKASTNELVSARDSDSVNIYSSVLIEIPFVVNNRKPKVLLSFVRLMIFDESPNLFSRNARYVSLITGFPVSTSHRLDNGPLGSPGPGQGRIHKNERPNKIVQRGANKGQDFSGNHAKDCGRSFPLKSLEELIPSFQLRVNKRSIWFRNEGVDFPFQLLDVLAGPV